MMMVGMLELLLAFFIAIDTSEVYPPEVAEAFVENSLVGQTFTHQLPDTTAAVFMVGNFGVCKSKKGIVIPLSEAVRFAKEMVSKTGRPERAEERLEMVDVIHDISKSVLRMFHGEVGIALLHFPVGRRPPDLIVRADIDESEMSLMKLMEKIAAALPMDSSRFLPREEDGYFNFGDKLYVRIKDGRLYASNSRLIVEKFLSGAWKENPLSQSPLYREAGKKVEFDQEQFLFVNVEHIWEEFIAAHEPMPGEIKTLFAGLVSNMWAIASSTRLSNGNLDVRSAALFRDLTKGIPRILARPNARSQAATFVPPDYSLLVKVHTGSPAGLLRDVMALNEDVARGLRKALDEMDEKLGFSVEGDLLRALSGDFAVAAKIPPMIGLPESVAIIRIADHDKAASAIKSIFAVAGMAPGTTAAESIGFEEEYRGAKLQVVPLPLVALTYVFVEGHLLVGSSPEVVKAAIDAHLSGQNLAASEGYKSAFMGHPSESFVTSYADTETIFNGLLNIGGGLAMWKGRGEIRQFIVPLIALLRRNVKELTPISCSVYREDNAVVVRTNSRLFGAGPVPIALPWLFIARSVEVTEEAMRRRDEAITRQEEFRRDTEEMRLRDEMLDRAEREGKERAIQEQMIERALGERR